VSPLRGEKPQNWPLSKLNTGRFALRAMLPVNITLDENILILSFNCVLTLCNVRQTKAGSVAWVVTFIKGLMLVVA